MGVLSKKKYYPRKNLIM